MKCLRKVFPVNHFMRGWKFDNLGYACCWKSDDGNYIDAYVWIVKDGTYSIKITINDEVKFYDDNVIQFNSLGRVVEYVDNNIMKLIGEEK